MWMYQNTVDKISPTSLSAHFVSFYRRKRGLYEAKKKRNVEDEINKLKAEQ